MKKEIELWVEPEDIENLNNYGVLYLYPRRDAVSSRGQMVKLLYQMPEKKIEITEAQFDEMVTDIGVLYYGKETDIAKLKQRLFGEDK